MSVGASAIVREMNGYLDRHPTEGTAMMPLFLALRDHTQLRGCSHRGRCPVVRAGAVLVDEHERVLAVRNGTRWSFVEDAPDASDTSLRRTSIRVLEENAGVYNAWTVPGAEDPLLIEVSDIQTEAGRRLRYGFRYLLRARSRALLPSMAELGQARWVPLGELGSPLLNTRLQDQLATVPS
ncbi:NUDIX domain-containing protein [Streptomyces scopuliridis]|uniref:NUDIX domain-containing protein n=1 Tax=Streptomyces scopuliridis TaxID=452529 RepID=UPI003676E958